MVVLFWGIDLPYIRVLYITSCPHLHGGMGAELQENMRVGWLLSQCPGLLSL